MSSTPAAQIAAAQSLNPTVEAIAEHDVGAIGGMLPIQTCTRITTGALYGKGGRFIATYPGHLADGTTMVIHGVTYVLRVQGQDQRVAA